MVIFLTLDRRQGTEWLDGISQMFSGYLHFMSMIVLASMDFKLSRGKLEAVWTMADDTHADLSMMCFTLGYIYCMFVQLQLIDAHCKLFRHEVPNSDIYIC